MTCFGQCNMSRSAVHHFWAGALRKMCSSPCLFILSALPTVEAQGWGFQQPGLLSSCNESTPWLFPQWVELPCWLLENIQCEREINLIVLSHQDLGLVGYQSITYPLLADTLSQASCLSIPFLLHFLHHQNQEDNSNELIGLLWELNKLMHAKHLDQCREHSIHSGKVSFISITKALLFLQKYN